MVVCCCLAGTPVFAQYVTGSREMAKPFFRAGEEIEVTLKLNNAGTDPQAIAVVEAIPEGWTVLKVSSDGQTSPAGTVQSAIDENYFTIFNPDPHVEGFNNVQTFWSNQEGGGYPYAGKSTVSRGNDANEFDMPQPLNVYDLQLHPPNNTHLTVAAFIAPVAGDYTISDLAARRVFNQGATVTFLVFDSGKQQVTALTAANDQIWIWDSESYTLKNIKANDRIYFAVSYDGDYGWDATEIAFTVKTGSTVWRSYNTVVNEGLPQASIPDDSGKIEANLEFYESENEGGVNPNNPDGQSTLGNIITWHLNAAPGSSTLTYTVKAPDAPKSAPVWFGTCAGYGIRGTTTLRMISKTALLKGIRSASLPYYRAGDEFTLSIEVTNPGTEAKTITIMEAVPDGWTVSSVSHGGTIATGGEIASIDQGLFTAYTPGLHGEGFNNLKEFWSNQSGGGYPYAGKSSVLRGNDANETNTPQPLGVSDLQIHPPQNDHLTVAAFVAPIAGSYSLSDFAIRRAYNQGATVLCMVLDASVKEVASLSASNDQAWVTDTNNYTLGNLKVGDRVYFTVSRDGDYGWDATELSFTLKTGSTVWHSYDIVTADGFPQAGVFDETGKTEARIDFYESIDDFGVEQNTASTTAPGSVITWKQSIAPGSTALTYKVKTPATPTSTASWIGVSDGILIGGLQSMSLLLPAVGLFDGHMDIGSVAAAGDALYKTSTSEYEVTGSGADIWGTADAFHFLFKEVYGDFVLKATLFVDPFESMSDWVKGGLMARDTLEPGAVFYDAILNTSLQATTQWRLTPGSSCADTATTLGTDVQEGTLEIVRTGNKFSTYYINTTTRERTLYNSRTIEMTDPVYLGLAITSHEDGHLSTGIFSKVELTANTDVKNWSLF